MARAEIHRDGRSEPEVVMGTEEQIRAMRDKAGKGAWLKWLPETGLAEEVAVRRLAEEDAPGEHAIVPLEDKQSMKKINAAIKRLFRGHGTIFSDGKGQISNGHWLVRFSGDALEYLPEAVEIPRMGLFPLKGKKAEWRSPDLNTGEDASVPDFSHVTGDLDKKNMAAQFTTEQNYVKVLMGHGLDIYEVFLGDVKTYVNKTYVDDILALGGRTIHDLPRVETTGIDYTPLVLRVTKGINALIMPVRY